jgi:outer membrane translocation and assembly module TamA
MEQEQGYSKTISKLDQKKLAIKRRVPSQTQDQDTDHNTLATVNTQASFTHDTIRDLQNNSYQHQQLDNHTRRIDTINSTSQHSASSTNPR